MPVKTARDLHFEERVNKNRDFINAIRMNGKAKVFDVMDINGNPSECLLGVKSASDGVDWKAIGQTAFKH